MERTSHLNGPITFNHAHLLAQTAISLKHPHNYQGGLKAQRTADGLVLWYPTFSLLGYVAGFSEAYKRNPPLSRRLIPPDFTPLPLETLLPKEIDFLSFDDMCERPLRGSSGLYAVSSRELKIRKTGDKYVATFRGDTPEDIAAMIVDFLILCCTYAESPSMPIRVN